MSASIDIKRLTKVFSLSEKPGKTVSLFEALRLGVRKENTRQVRALDGVSFRVESGERVGIIGRNGAGKTTLLSILSGITQATSGTVNIDGAVHAMLTIGAVLKEDMTGRENILLDVAVHGRSDKEIEGIVEDMIEFSELGEFIERPVRTYSSGMKARLAFSMGAFIDPDILILDETLAVGDVFFAEKAGRKMKEVAKQGRIVVMVTHAAATIVEMCTRCLWLDNGRIVMDGDPVKVTSAYETTVQDADEATLRLRFGDQKEAPGRSDRGGIETVQIFQNGAQRQAHVEARESIVISVSGALRTRVENCDILLDLLRVDGRQIWHDSSIHAGQSLTNNGTFNVQVTLDSFILGADLYRLDVRLVDSSGLIDSAVRVFEVIDKEGQFGGKPLLLYAPQIKVTKVAGSLR